MDEVKKEYLKTIIKAMEDATWEIKITKPVVKTLIGTYNEVQLEILYHKLSFGVCEYILNINEEEQS